MEVTILPGQKRALSIAGHEYEIKSLHLIRKELNETPKDMFFYSGSDIYDLAVIAGTTSKAYLLSDGRINLL